MQHDADRKNESVLIWNWKTAAHNAIVKARIAEFSKEMLKIHELRHAITSSIDETNYEICGSYTKKGLILEAQCSLGRIDGL